MHLLYDGQGHLPRIVVLRGAEARQRLTERLRVRDSGAVTNRSSAQALTGHALLRGLTKSPKAAASHCGTSAIAGVGAQPPLTPGADVPLRSCRA